jgi:cytochrome c peroxidase
MRICSPTKEKPSHKVSIRTFGHASEAASLTVFAGLAARAPYFHNGAAADLAQVVSFYNQRFQMHLTPEQKSDPVAFLAAL